MGREADDSDDRCRLMVFQVYATRWDDPHYIEEVPAQGLEFSLPLSDHGECSFSAMVEPGRSFWRSALSCATSGILVCSDGVPVWSGQMLPEDQAGRTFQLKFAEWGTFFERTPAVPLNQVGVNDHSIFRKLISDAQAISGQNVGVVLGSTLGSNTSDLTIHAWDSAMVEEQFRRIAEAEGGPEWYFAAGGTLENPTRTLILGDRLGSVTPTAVLEYVEDTQDWQAPAPPPTLTMLGALFPADHRQFINGQRRGGNVIAMPVRRQSPGYTATVAVGAGDQAAQIRRTASATALLAAGYPRQTLTSQYTDVTAGTLLQRQANADLAANSGMVTSYTLTTFADDPDWTQIARGDTVRVELDTDVYGGERPLIFNTRVLDRVVHVPDEGRPLVNWVVADVREF